MLQAFYWDVPESTDGNSWWKVLEKKAQEFHDAGFTGVWIPPPYKGAAGKSDVGYGVYDHYDLGEFDQKGSIATHYGTFAELQAAIQSLHTQQIQVYADVVMNHMMGADTNDHFSYGGQEYDTPTHFKFGARNNKYSDYTWQYYNFNGVQLADHSWLKWKGGWDFEPYPDAWDNLMGCEIRYLDESNRKELIRWGKWLTETLQLDGYRIDAARHIYTDFLNQWFDDVKGPRFCVSEAAFFDVDEMRDYANRTGRRTTLFDFPLHKVFAETLTADGNGDLRRLRFAGYTEVDGPLSVSFVDNHDTDRDFPVRDQKMLAYAYILMRDKGYPCVFYKDYYEYGLGDQIRKLIAIRREHAFGPSWEHQESDSDVYVYSRAGNAVHAGLLLMLCDRSSAPKTVRTPFVNAHLRDLTGNQSGEVVTDANGTGSFPVKGGSYSIWSPILTATHAITASVAPATSSTGARGAFVPATDPFNETVTRIAYVDQNWSDAQSDRFHFTPQGSQIIPYDWFLALEQVDSTTSFRDNQNFLKYRYLPQLRTMTNPDGLPIGFVRDPGSGRDWLGMTCAACHTAEIHYNNVGYRIDGAPTQADAPAFLAAITASLQQTQQDSAKFARFAGQVLGTGNSTAAQARLQAQLEAMIGIRAGYNLRNFPEYDPAQLHPPLTSFGRLDAVDAIVNEVYHLAVRIPNPGNPTEEARPANAPVSYPFLWDTPQHQKVEWLGIAKSGGIAGIFSLGRNVGEVIGVFGNVAIPDSPSLFSFGYRSSVKIDELRELEGLVETLWSPQWPQDFPPIDISARDKGAVIYGQLCASCHKIIQRDDPNRTAGEKLTAENTDPQAAINFFTRTGKSGKLEGAPANSLPFSPKIPAIASAGDMLGNVVIGTILGGLRDAPPDQLNEITFQRTTPISLLAEAAPLARYKARPLNGIWATAPYLHNGSVPNLDALLRPAAQRPTTFEIGSRRFDPAKVGFKTEGGGFPKFNVRQSDGTPIIGNSNVGHEWGTSLDETSRQQLIEYLKSL